MNIPTHETIELSQAERFLIGLKELVNETGMKSWSMTTCEFNDGSRVGNNTAYSYALGHLTMAEARQPRK